MFLYPAHCHSGTCSYTLLTVSLGHVPIPCSPSVWVKFLYPAHCQSGTCYYTLLTVSLGHVPIPCSLSVWDKFIYPAHCQSGICSYTMLTVSLGHVIHPAHCQSWTCSYNMLTVSLGHVPIPCSLSVWDMFLYPSHCQSGTCSYTSGNGFWASNKDCPSITAFWEESFYPLYTEGFFLLVWYNKLRIVHCRYRMVSGYNFEKRLYFLSGDLFNAAFHLGLHCLQKYWFRGLWTGIWWGIMISE